MTSDSPMPPPVKKQRLNGIPDQSTVKSSKHIFTCKITLHGHTAAVTAAKYSPNGKYIATASSDSTIKIWSAYTGNLFATLVGHLRGISDLSWCPDSKHLVSVSDDKSVRVWDAIITQKVVRILRGHTHYATSVDVNKKGNLIVSGSSDENLKIWDLRHSKCLRTLAAHTDPVSAVCFSKDGTVIASASHDGLIRLWDTRAGHCLKTFVGETNSPILYVSFLPNDEYLLSSTLDGRLRMWDIRKNQVVKTYLYHEDDLEQQPSETDTKTEIKTEDSQEENAKEKTPETINEYKYSSRSMVLPTLGPGLVAQGIGKHTIAFWELQSRVLIDRLNDHEDIVFDLCYHPNLDEFVSASADGTAKIWSLNNDYTFK